MVAKNQTETLEVYLCQMEEDVKALSESSPPEEKVRVLARLLEEAELQAEHYHWLHLNDRAIMGEYRAIIDSLKKLETIEAVKTEIAAGELFIAKMWHTFDQGFKKHMEEWEKK